MNQKQIDKRNRKRDAIIKILDGETWFEVETLLEQPSDKYHTVIQIKVEVMEWSKEYCHHVDIDVLSVYISLYDSCIIEMVY